MNFDELVQMAIRNLYISGGSLSGFSILWQKIGENASQITVIISMLGLCLALLGAVVNIWFMLRRDKRDRTRQ